MPAGTLTSLAWVRSGPASRTRTCFDPSSLSCEGARNTAIALRAQGSDSAAVWWEVRQNGTAGRAEGRDAEGCDEFVIYTGCGVSQAKDALAWASIAVVRAETGLVLLFTV